MRKTDVYGKFVLLLSACKVKFDVIHLTVSKYFSIIYAAIVSFGKLKTHSHTYIVLSYRYYVSSLNIKISFTSSRNYYRHLPLSLIKKAIDNLCTYSDE